MPDYRICCRDDRGDVVQRFVVACTDDLDAIRLAYDLCSDYDVEVWEGDRPIYVVTKGARRPKILGAEP